MNLEEQFYQQFPSAGDNYGITEVVHAQKVGIEIIPFYLVITSRLKKSSYKGGTKIVPSRFSSRPASHINSPLEKSVKAGKLPVEPWDLTGFLITTLAIYCSIIFYFDDIKYQLCVKTKHFYKLNNLDITYLINSKNFGSFLNIRIAVKFGILELQNRVTKSSHAKWSHTWS